MQACLFSFAIIYFHIQDVYGTPSCNGSYDLIKMSENTHLGSVVYNITCSDASGTVTYTITDGNTQGKFAVNTTRNGIGQVILNQPISFESRVTSFQLQIEVSNKKILRASTYFHLDISITGVNDYAPLFLFSPYTVYINENLPPGSLLSAPIPYDFDKGADGETTSMILDGDGSGLFYMDASTAKVYLRSALDYETVTEYRLTLQVTDNGHPKRRSSTTILNIYVKDINDNPPQCEEHYITETILETKPEGTPVRFLKCEDKDSGNNGRITHTIVEGDYTKFRIQAGWLMLWKPIDVDTEDSVWPLSVRIRDRGNPRLSTVLDIVIYVEGVDDNIPYWGPPLYGNFTVSMKENAPVGSHVIQISALDSDTPGTPDSDVMYAIDQVGHFFNMRLETGDVYIKHVLDRETKPVHIIPVRAFSSMNTDETIHSYVRLTLIDVNDNKPTFKKDVFTFTVPEDTSVSTDLFSVEATDADLGDNGVIGYSIRVGNRDRVFKINSTSGVVQLAGSLDYENIKSYVLRITATDKGSPSLTSTATAIIEVLPANEFEPIFNVIKDVSIPENAKLGTSVLKIKATDADDGEDGQIRYTLGSFNDTFLVEARTGVIRVMVSLDRETKDLYNVVVLAEDLSSSRPKTGTATTRISVIDSNDNSPSCIRFHYVTVTAPVSSGDNIQDLNCTDGDSGPNARLSYAILFGNKNNDFAISSTGSLVIARKPSHSEYRLDILVRDSGSPQRNSTVVVTVQMSGKPILNNLPTRVEVNEGEVLGAILFTVEAGSASSNLRYRVHGRLSKSIVKIDEYTGDIYLWSELDREESDTYRIDVVVRDAVSGIEASSYLYLIVQDINDNTPQFRSSVYNISVIENVKPGTILLKLNADDADTGDNSKLTFSLPSGDDAKHFAVSRDGLLTIQSTIDREDRGAISLEVLASDNGRDIGLTGTATVLISVIDTDEYPPEFITIGSSLQTTIPEDAPLGALLFHTEARDLDAQSDIKYSLDEKFKENFIIDKFSGNIYLAKFLDREVKSSYSLFVTAENNHGVQTSAQVFLEVADVNDNDPKFSKNIYYFEVLESALVNSYIALLNCTDADTGSNGAVTVSIINGNVGSTFRMKDKILELNAALNYDMFNEYILTLEGKDGGIPPRSSSASIVIEVKPNYQKPKFFADLQVIHVFENTQIGTTLHNVDATKEGAKEGPNGELVYTIVAGNEGQNFLVSNFDGQISLTKLLERDRHKESYTVAISARSKYDPDMHDVMTLKIIVEDINDETPTFEEDRYFFKVEETFLTERVVGKVSASDMDAGLNAKISYWIDEEQTSDFRLDENTGEVIVKELLDYSRESEYQFTVFASDHGSPQLTGTTYVTIAIEDVNNHSPEFSNPLINLNVREDARVGKKLRHFIATDEDTGANGDITYNIVGGNSEGTFVLNSESGHLRLGKTLDRERVNEYSIVIFAVDDGYPKLTGTATMTIKVGDINDNGPVFSEKEYSASLDRLTAVDTFVISVSASDNDEGSNAAIEYRLADAAGASSFYMDSKTGIISTFADLSDHENTFHLEVIAIDRGKPRLSSSTTLRIDLHPSLQPETKDYNFTVSEYAPPHSFIGSIGGQDSSGYTYEIKSGNYKDHFRVGHEDGRLVLNGIVDREDYQDYFLVLEKSFGNIPYLTEEIDVHIQILDENDNIPVFRHDVYHVELLEHSPEGYKILRVTADDADSGRNSDLTYTIAQEDSLARDFLRMSIDGDISISQAIRFEDIQTLNFTILAADRGIFSRTGTAKVNLTVVDISEDNFDLGGKHSSFFSFEVPMSVKTGDVLVRMIPSMFGFNASSSATVKYITLGADNIFNINRDSGNIVVSSEEYIFKKTIYFLWVVAHVSDSLGARAGLALMRLDTLEPNKHIVVLTHAAAVEIVEINKESLKRSLKRLFPGGRAEIWKIEGDTLSGERRLLSTEARTYLYVVKDDSVDRLTQMEKFKQFYTQDDLLRVLLTKDGGVSEALTSEEFDSFPIVDVARYTGPGKVPPSFMKTTTGKATIGIITGNIILMVVLVSLYFWCTRGNVERYERQRGRAMSLNIPPIATAIKGTNYEKFNNVNAKINTAKDSLPIVSALKAFGNLTDEEMMDLGKSIRKQVNISNDSANPDLPDIKNNGRLLGAESSPQTPKDAEEFSKAKTQSARTKPAPRPPSSKGSSSSDNENKVAASIETNGAEDQKKMEKSIAFRDDASLTSLELENETEVRPEPLPYYPIPKQKRQPPKRKNQIIIDGKEYDGVGKDTDNRQYVYNTQAGDKVYVSDEVLQKALERRVPDSKSETESNVNYTAQTKAPVRRKTSRTRYSTTTIWEMSADQDDGKTPSTSHILSKLLASELYTYESEEKDKLFQAPKRRRAGIDNTKEFQKSFPAVFPNANSNKVPLGKESGLENSTNLLYLPAAVKSENIKLKAKVGNSNDGADTEAIKHPDGTADVTDNATDSDIDVEEFRRKISANKKWDKVLEETGYISKSAVDNLNTRKERCSEQVGDVSVENTKTSDITMKMSNISEEESLKVDTWKMASKLVGFVRPVYRPLNLEGVTCKVPKGRSDPKDCLSKDPVYAGWAKVVGRRYKTKALSKKTVRQGGSLPIEPQTVNDVSTFTKSVAAKLPPHLARKRLSCDLQVL